MAAELRDLRARISVEADVALSVECKRRGLDRSEVIREILDNWADDRIHAAHDLIAGLKAEGVEAAPKGSRGRIANLGRASRKEGES